MSKTPTFISKFKREIDRNNYETINLIKEEFKIVKDNQENTPLHLAVKRGNVNVSKYLSNSTSSNINQTNKLGVSFIF